MDETGVETDLRDLLENVAMANGDKEDEIEVPEELAGLDWVATFYEQEVLTNNAGLVIRMEDGNEFQITIVRSR